MSITGKEVFETFYQVSATPPHVTENWHAPGPLRMHLALRELIARGVHQIDADDAINDADREWLQVRSSISFSPDLYETLEKLAAQKKASLAWVV